MDIGNAIKSIAVLLILIVVAGVLLVVLLFGGSEETGMESSGQESQLHDQELLTDEGKNNGLAYYDKKQTWIEETLIPLAGDVHWTILEAIYEQDAPSGEKDSCEDKWVGPMKLQELHWTSIQLLDNLPHAETDFTDCGDVSDDVRDQVIDVDQIEQYAKNRKVIKACNEKQMEQEKEFFCIPYGQDGDENGKADPKKKEDAIATAAYLLADYQATYGNMGQALYRIYGENEAFLRGVKNQLTDWLKDPSPWGIFRWPLATDQAANKEVTKRFKKGASDLTIKSAADQQVLAVATGFVTEVGEDSSCGNYVKLQHAVSEGEGDLVTTYCQLKEVAVKEEDHLEIGQELGKAGEKSLVIKMSFATEDENPENEQTKNDEIINPEIYLTAPEDVVYSEEGEG